MKIVKLTAENVKKIKVVEVTPAGAVVEVTGPNGSGKTSVLDAIYFALRGGEVIPAQVVRKGEEKAFVKLDLGELVVTRKFKADGATSLVVEAQSGARFPSPQRMLDELVGALSFDPLEFVRMDPSDQLLELRRVVKLDVDIDEIDLRTKKLVEARTETNRELRSSEAQLAAAPCPEGEIPEEPVSISSLMDEIRDANERNALAGKEREARDWKRRQLVADEKMIKAYQDQADQAAARAEARILDLRAAIDKAQKEGETARSEALGKAERLREVLDADLAELEALDPVPANVETGVLVQQAREAEDTNKRIEQRKRWKELDARVRQKRADARAFTEGIDSNAKERAEALARAEMPVAGLALGDAQVLYNGLPLESASSAEQLCVSVAIAMAANPKLKVLRVKDGSLLDAQSLELLARTVADEGYQMWIERVEEADGRPCVVMEDGAVKAAGAGQ